MNSPNWVRHLNKRILQKFASNPGGTIAHALRISRHDKQEKPNPLAPQHTTRTHGGPNGHHPDFFHAMLQHKNISNIQAKDKSHKNHYARFWVIINSQKV